MTTITHSRPAASGLLDRVAAFLKSSGTSIEQYGIYRRTLRDLSALSSRDLADLGLSRGDIHRVAMEAAFGET